LRVCIVCGHNPIIMRKSYHAQITILESMTYLLETANHCEMRVLAHHTPWSLDLKLGLTHDRTNASWSLAWKSDAGLQLPFSQQLLCTDKQSVLVKMRVAIFSQNNRTCSLQESWQSHACSGKNERKKIT
jgi:hypothetical protein